MPELLDVHRALLERWRTRMNLVGPGPLDHHYEDCTRALAWLTPTGRWADLGSGAGFPGMVLAALHPELSLELVDRRRKRCAFLERVLVEAEVPPDRVRVCCRGVETLEAGVYDGVTARAFAPLEEVVPQAARLLRSGGTAVLFLQDHTRLPPVAGFEVGHVERYRVGHRNRRAVGLHRI